MGLIENRRKIWSVLAPVGLVIVGVMVIVDKEFTAAAFWAIWVPCFCNALANLIPAQDGIAVERQAMSPERSACGS